MTTRNNLAAAQLQYPAITKTLLYQEKQYTFTMLAELLGRVTKNNVELIGDIEIQWRLQGRLKRPAIVVGFIGAGRGLGNSVFSLEFRDNYLNPYDRIRFRSGRTAIVIGVQQLGVTWKYDLKLESSDPLNTVPATDVVAGDRHVAFGNAQPSFSKKGYSAQAYPETHTNFLTIQRWGKTIAADAATTVTWVENNGERLWTFTDFDHMMKNALYELEAARKWGRSTMNAATSTTPVTDSDNQLLVTGDGIDAQIDPGNVQSYIIATKDMFTDYMAYLATRSNFPNNEWIVFTGMPGYKTIQDLFIDHIMVNRAMLYDMSAGREIEVGFEVCTIHYAGQKMTVVMDPQMHDMQLFGNQLDPANGMPLMGSTFYFLNFGIDGEKSNIEIYSKGAGGHNRSFVLKYLPGMIDLENPNSQIAVSSEDGHRMEMLTDSCVVIRDPKSCGKLEKVIV